MMKNLLDLKSALMIIKTDIENAIRSKGSTGKNNLIRTQKPIKLLHEVVKSELIRKKVPSYTIFPCLNQPNGELALAGFFKTKAQDVCVAPLNCSQISERLKVKGTLYGYNDPYGKNYTEKVLSINVRSQLSSMAKNFDTLYERTFAEALNLHLRCPNMVLGEFYMIAVNEYDSDAANNYKVKFRDIKGINKQIEKYILSFSALNNRLNVAEEHYKYERICLLIVDFKEEIPIIYSSDEQLKKAGLLDINSPASIKEMTFESFIETLLHTYRQRFGTSSFNS